MIGTGRIAGRGADAAIVFGNQVVVAQRLIRRVAPELLTHPLVQPLGEGFRQPVGQRLQQDGAVIVMRALECRHSLINADAGGDGERAQGVGQAGFVRCDPVGQAVMRFALRFRTLLTQVMQREQWLIPGRVGIERDVVLADPVGREKADDRPRRQPAVGDDLVQHRLGVGEQVAGVFALFGIVENRWIAPAQFPGVEKRRPVNAFRQFRQRVIVEGADAEESRLGREVS